MAKQSVRVHVFNQSYTLLTEGDPRELEELAGNVDALMTSIAEKSNAADTTRVAVLACIHLADQLREARAALGQADDRSARINALTEALDGLSAGT